MIYLVQSKFRKDKHWFDIAMFKDLEIAKMYVEAVNDNEDDYITRITKLKKGWASAVRVEKEEKKKRKISRFKMMNRK